MRNILRSFTGDFCISMEIWKPDFVVFDLVLVKAYKAMAIACFETPSVEWTMCGDLPQLHDCLMNALI